MNNLVFETYRGVPKLIGDFLALNFNLLNQEYQKSEDVFNNSFFYLNTKSIVIRNEQQILGATILKFYPIKTMNLSCGLVILLLIQI